MFKPFLWLLLLLYKPLYSLWGNFCYPLSILFKLRIKLRFYCQKPSVYRAFGHRKSDLKDCSSRSLKDIKIYTLQDNGCCTITCEIIPTPKYKTDFNCFCLGILTWFALIWYRLSQFYEVFLLLLSNSYHLYAIIKVIFSKLFFL